jgi:hypothetical protein
VNGDVTAVRGGIRQSHMEGLPFLNSRPLKECRGAWDDRRLRNRSPLYRATRQPLVGGFESTTGSIEFSRRSGSSCGWEGPRFPLSRARRAITILPMHRTGAAQMAALAEDNGSPWPRQPHTGPAWLRRAATRLGRRENLIRRGSEGTVVKLGGSLDGDGEPSARSRQIHGRPPPVRSWIRLPEQAERWLPRKQ